MHATTKLARVAPSAVTLAIDLAKEMAANVDRRDRLSVWPCFVGE